MDVSQKKKERLVLRFFYGRRKVAGSDQTIVCIFVTRSPLRLYNSAASGAFGRRSVMTVSDKVNRNTVNTA